MTRDSKNQYYDKLASKLKSDQLSSKDWWSIFITFIAPHSNSSLPPFESNGIIYTDEYDKANILNNYFQNQTLLNEQNAILPDLPVPSYHIQLSVITFIPCPHPQK